MKRNRLGMAMLCALLSAGCSSAQGGFAATAPLRHVALKFDEGQWSAEFKGPGLADSKQLMILHRDSGLAIGVTEFESFKPLRMESVVARQLSEGLRTQFGSVAPAGPDSPLHALALPAEWTCDQHVVARLPGAETRGYTSCVHSEMAWFANLVVITPVDASKAEIAAANAVLSTLRAD